MGSDCLSFVSRRRHISSSIQDVSGTRLALAHLGAFSGSHMVYMRVDLEKGLWRWHRMNDATFVRVIRCNSGGRM